MPATGHNTTDRIVIDDINRRLTERARSLDGRPILRIVWTTDQREMRAGEFTDWYMNTIIIRTVKAIREVPKYNYAPDRWVLERLTYLNPDNEIAKNELVGAQNGTYEPLVMFHDSNYVPFPVHWSLVEQIIWRMENGKFHGDEGKQSDAQLYAQELAAQSKEIEHDKLALAEKGRSDLFAFEDSVFLDSTKRKVAADAASGSGHSGAGERRRRQKAAKRRLDRNQHAPVPAGREETGVVSG